MSIFWRPVGRQHKQLLRHRSKLVMNSADISHNTSRSAAISYPRPDKLISESSSLNPTKWKTVKFFRILSTMEPKRNNFRCRKPSKDTEEQSYDWEYLGVVLHQWRHNLARPRSPIRGRELFRVGLRRGTENRGFDRFKKCLHRNTPKNTLILFSEKQFGG